MKFRNTTKLLLSGVLAMAMLSACSPAEKHTHTADQWDRDINSHWQACACGEKMGEAAAHTLGEYNMCTECGTVVDKFAGKICLYNYNELEDMLRSTEYNTEGELISDDRYTYQYDENNNYVHIEAFYDGRLADVYDYGMTADGKNYMAKLTSHYPDGTARINEYDAEENTIATIELDSDGKTVAEAYFEYALGSDGKSYMSKVTDSADGFKYITEYNEYGDIIRWNEYEGKDLLNDHSYEYTYDADGQMLSEKITENGMLVQECHYVITKTENGFESYAETIIDYFEDGTKIVAKYDENHKFVEEITYDKDGNVIGANG